MTDSRMEQHIADAVAKAAPDMAEELMKELGITDERPVVQKEFAPARRSRSWKRIIASAAAAVMLFAGGYSVISGMNSREAMAVVGIDVNPSIEISINRDEKVISATAVNDDGKDLIDDMELKGCDIDVACSALIGSMLMKGYLTDTSNSILVSVRASDAAKGRDIEKHLADNLNQYFENTQIAAAILGQYVQDDDEINDFAKANGISVGKAWLIRNLLDTGSTRMTEESLLKLSTQELIMLGQTRNVANDTSYGSADTSRYVGEGKALETALDHAGISRADADMIEIEFDCEDGVIVYEVEFVSGSSEYEYDIDAVKGSVLYYETEEKHDVSDQDDKYDRDDDDPYDDDKDDIDDIDDADDDDADDIYDRD